MTEDSTSPRATLRFAIEYNGLSALFALVTGGVGPPNTIVAA